MLELLLSKIRKIEIVYEKNTMTIFYPSHPLFEFLSDHTKEQLLFNISRGTQREKILGLLE
jgi:inositol 1,4,5-triphosphate receptor type 1/inositol 1,4,5-triphosphate receptor type 3